MNKKRPAFEIINIFKKGSIEQKPVLPKSTLEWIQGDVPILKIQGVPYT